MDVLQMKVLQQLEPFHAAAAELPLFPSWRTDVWAMWVVGIRSNKMLISGGRQ